MVDVDAAFNAAANRIGLIGGEIVSRAITQQQVDLLHRLGKVAVFVGIELRQDKKRAARVAQ